MTINASQLHVWFYLISPKQQPITLMFSSNMLIDRLYFFPLFILFACIQQAARFISQVFNINRGKNFLERRSCLLYFREQVSFTYSRIIFPSLVIYNFISWPERVTFVSVRNMIDKKLHSLLCLGLRYRMTRGCITSHNFHIQ